MTSDDSALRDLIDDAELLSRGYLNGHVQKRPLEERRRWAGDAAHALALLAKALREQLGAEHNVQAQMRIQRRNLKARETGRVIVTLLGDGG